MSITTKDTDLGAERIMRDLKLISNSFATIGVHEDAGNYTGPGSNPSVAEVAFWNEFGTKTSPARPYMRSTVDTKKSRIDQFGIKQLNMMVRGQITPKQVLDRVGFKIESLVKNRILTARSWADPNKPSTANRKLKGGAARGASPLVESLLLFRSITHQTKIVRRA